MAYGKTAKPKSKPIGPSMPVTPSKSMATSKSGDMGGAKMSQTKKAAPPVMQGKQKMTAPPVRPGMKPKSVKP